MAGTGASKGVGVGSRFLRRTGSLIRLGCGNTWICTANLLLFLLLAASLANVVVIKQVGEVPSRFYGVLTRAVETPAARAAQRVDFLREIRWSVLWIVLAMTLKSGAHLAAELVAVHWRGNVTEYAHRVYVSTGILHRVCCRAASVDNPDQRLARDIENATQTLAQIIEKLAATPVNAVYYSVLTYGLLGWRGLVAVLVFVAALLGVQRLLAVPLSRAVADVEGANGDLRRLHVRIRERALDIDLIGGAPFERARADRKLSAAIASQRRAALWSLGVTAWASAGDYLGAILAYLVLGTSIVQGDTWGAASASELAAIISRGAFIVIMNVNAFTTMADAGELVAELAGYVGRVFGLFDECRKAASEADADAAHRSRLEPPTRMQEDSAVVVDRDARSCQPPLVFAQELTVYNGRSLELAPVLSRISLAVASGSRVAITGASGCGKTTLLRTLRGAAADGAVSGTALVKPALRVSFSTQTAYLPEGTLLDLVAYPEPHTEEGRALAALEAVGASYLSQQYGDGVFSCWSRMLSGGEQQRIVAARVVYAQPDVWLADEPTSALPTDAARELLSRVFATLPRVTAIAVIHDAALLDLFPETVSLPAGR